MAGTMLLGANCPREVLKTLRHCPSDRCTTSGSRAPKKTTNTGRTVYHLSNGRKIVHKYDSEGIHIYISGELKRLYLKHDCITLFYGSNNGWSHDSFHLRKSELLPMISELSLCPRHDKSNPAAPHCQPPSITTERVTHQC